MNGLTSGQNKRRPMPRTPQSPSNIAIILSHLLILFQCHQDKLLISLVELDGIEPTTS